jgi:integrase
MSVYRVNGVWHYRFMYKGTVLRRSTRQGNKRDAELMEAKHRTALAMGEAGLGDKPACETLEHFLGDRILTFAKNQIVTTLRWFKDGMTPLRSYRPLAKLPLDRITSESVAEYIAHRRGLGRAVGSINRDLRVLRRSLHLAVEWKLLDKSPEITMAGAEVRRERVVTEAEFARYLACTTPLLADVAVILNETGLRPDECHRLEWADVDFENNRLLVRHGKTPAARRLLPLTRNVRGVLESRWQASGTPEDGFVFPSSTRSGHIDHSTTKKQHRSALKASKVRPFVIYSLRHTFASRIAPAVDAFTLCKIMGWASLSVAMTYVHADHKLVLAAFSGPEFGHVAAGRLLADSAATTLNP